jgi:SAM-dependent methyltransferase
LVITAEDLLRHPSTDPTAIYRYRDGLYAADLLTAALCHLQFFDWLHTHPLSGLPAICSALGLKERPVDVMLTLFAAMGLVERKGADVQLTQLAEEHLLNSSPWCIAPYFASVKERPVCRDLVEVLRTGRPATWASLPSEKEWEKAMETEPFASQFTAAMDCRGIYLAPAMAERLRCERYRHLLDIAGGSGIYACALAARQPQLQATVLERGPVARLAIKALAERGFAGRVTVRVADMFRDPFPEDCDLHLFSNVLHDWDVPKVEYLLGQSYATLPPGGMIVIHDAHINAAKTGPLPVAAYSAMLMAVTEGKCYSEGELGAYLAKAGFGGVAQFSTAADRSVITATKPGHHSHS